MSTLARREMLHLLPRLLSISVELLGHRVGLAELDDSSGSNPQRLGNGGGTDGRSSLEANVTGATRTLDCCQYLVYSSVGTAAPSDSLLAS